jgi:3-dehydrosphinganine reductase
LSFPPDTDTPGFATEENSKPMETRLISQAAGLVPPEIVAKQIIVDALVSYISLDMYELCNNILYYYTEYVLCN